MFFRSPPIATRSEKSSPIYAFQKSNGPNGIFFFQQLIYRHTFRIRRGNDEIVRAVRYARRYWPIYEPETFPSNSAKWIAENNPVYGPYYAPVELPLEHPYLFDCDENPLRLYD